MTDETSFIPYSHVVRNIKNMHVLNIIFETQYLLMHNLFDNNIFDNYAIYLRYAVRRIEKRLKWYRVYCGQS